MPQLFPFDNIVAGILVLVIGFAAHWLGQGVSVLNWELATRLGLQEKGMPPEFKVYEHAIAVADVCVGWLYGIAGVGLLLDASWGYKLAWFTGAILLYHAISFWVWTGNQTKAGYDLSTSTGPIRIGWTAANVITGSLAILVAWHGS